MNIIRLLAVGKNFGDLVELKFKLLLTVPKSLLEKALDGWVIIVLGYWKPYRYINRLDIKCLRVVGYINKVEELNMRLMAI